MRRARGFTMVEILAVLFLMLMALYMFLEAGSFYHQALVKASGRRMVTHLSETRKLALTSKSHEASIVFRPTSGPYTSYVIFSEQDRPQEFELPRGVRIINTNGFIRNHTLKVDGSGAWLDETGLPRRAPEEGLLTLMSDFSDRVFVVRVDLATGQVAGR